MTLTLFLKAILAGILITMPVGPSAIIVIQKTIVKGRWAGFFASIGASIGDLIYGGIALWGLNYIIDFILAREATFQVAGSIILFGIGVFLFRSNPVKALNEKTSETVSAVKDSITTFFLVLSNPLLIFYFLSAFAFFKITGTGQQNELITAWVGFYTGVVIWFFTLTGIIHLVGTKFNIRRLKAINYISGSIVMILASVGLVHGIIKLVEQV